MGYRIKTGSDLTGIPKNTLIAWERRYGLVAPEGTGTTTEAIPMTTSPF